MSSRKNSSGDSSQAEGVTLTFEEYSTLTCQAQKAKELSKSKVIEAMHQVDEANVSRMEILKKVEEATEEVKTSKRALEEALNRVEAANRGKLAVEEALRKWRSDHGQKRRLVQNSTKFKNSYPSHHRRDSRLLDVNGLNLLSDASTPVLKPTLSIGQILSRKLLLPEEFETGILAETGTMKRKVSLGQMLGKQIVMYPPLARLRRKTVPSSFLERGRSLDLPVMDVRVGLLFLLVLSAGWACAARQMADAELSYTSLVISDTPGAATQGKDQEQERVDQASDGVIRNDQVCTLCEEFASQALDYLNENKTQTEIIDTLHVACSRVPPFKQQKINLCQEIVFISSKLQQDECGICHRAVSEVLLKLKNPDTQLEIIEMLLKACDSMENYAAKCKKLVFEYAPIIITEAEQFLETTDICTLLRACDSAVAGNGKQQQC
ncbi:hypothetical protein GH714_019088 [Hevea brasiliensis]|uniref:Pulmonary surfactant-associated protein B n=1 Tax=Hevea brasiliensis TaxID=3981 RepID=A0A6A6M151_HEVBR|nr:hypothetical protein GH714_019088 [Hevea brasiliensis]